MLITLSFKKGLIVEQFQGYYLKLGYSYQSPSYIEDLLLIPDTSC